MRYFSVLASVKLTFRSGAWIVFPTYMLYVFGAEILQGLELASGETKKTK